MGDLFKKIIIGVAMLSSVIGAALASSATATDKPARLFFVGPRAPISAGDIFTVTLEAGSDDPINAVQAILRYSATTLEALSVSTSNSIIDFWVREPVIIRNQSTIGLEGIIKNPGFSGSGGTLATIRFRALSSGVAQVSFVSALVLANDGNGTNVQAKTESAQYVIQGSSSLSKSLSDDPTLPRISSLTHPDSTGWYATSTAVFNWTLPPLTSATRWGISREVGALPSQAVPVSVRSKTIPDLANGVWYFQLQARTALGWGKVVVYRLQIDNEPPEPFAVTFPHGDVTPDQRPVVLFNTPDKISGIAYYEVKIGDSPYLKVVPAEVVESNPFVLPPREPGKYAVLVRAVDNAGNFREANAEVVINPLAMPLVSNFPADLDEGDLFQVQGSSYPFATAVVSVKDSKGIISMAETKSNNAGYFSLAWPKKLRRGTYAFWVQAIDTSGNVSERSAVETFTVHPVPLLESISAYNYIIIILVAVILVLFAIILFFSYRGFYTNRLLRKEAVLIRNTVHESLGDLAEQMRQDIKHLEQAMAERKLSAAEEKVLRDLRAQIRGIEKKIEEEIDVIEDEL
ncbi:MAG: hypothetical protein EXS55_00085 [Candidatus Magasanikbacteria bacterium]|nr:hypothetical protein [Candidatus Magasanikbacteria bacterium]